MITREQAARELYAIAKAAVEANGGEDYHYRNPVEDSEYDCLYVHDVWMGRDSRRESGCIVGRWLNEKHGVPLDTLALYEGRDARGVLDELSLDLAYDAAHFAVSVQLRQDGGDGWLKTVTEVAEYYDIDLPED